MQFATTPTLFFANTGKTTDFSVGDTMNKKITFLVALLVVATVCCLVACQPTTKTLNFIVDGNVYLSFQIGQKLVLPADPHLAGHTFQGWYLDDGTFSKPLSQQTLAEALEQSQVFAKFSKDQCKHVSLGHIVDNDKNCACDICGEIAHTPQVVPSVEATCQQTGLTEGQSCAVCNEILQEQQIVGVQPHSDVNNDARCQWCNLLLAVDGANLVLVVDSQTVEQGKSVSFNVHVEYLGNTFPVDDWQFAEVLGMENVTFDNNTIWGNTLGTVEFSVQAGQLQSNFVLVQIVEAQIPAESIVLSADATKIHPNGTATISAYVYPQNHTDDLQLRIVSGQNSAVLDGNVLHATNVLGKVVVEATCGNASAQIDVYVVAQIVEATSLSIWCNNTDLEVGESAVLNYQVVPSNATNSVVWVVTSGQENVVLYGNVVVATGTGQATIVGTIDGIVSNVIVINKTVITSDPYVGVSASEFYANYHPATSYMDAYYRTQHYFMSGSIADQDQAPTVAPNQPKNGNTLLRNSTVTYLDDGNTYVVYDANGNVANYVYKDGAYVTLEDVAAYLMAFGTVPPNYTDAKISGSFSSDWGKYYRGNHSQFSGNTSKYPYEPVLPRISGCGGDLRYYEIDIGTTGTDCAPAYPATDYNNGSKVVRGAARIVYTRYDLNYNGIVDPNEKYVFYTYNHYNDFQEYLNYQNGWGQMFGNITGGGQLSSKYNYNPTPYVATTLHPFANLTSSANQVALLPQSLVGKQQTA